jgi:hypothetical protein
VPVCCSCAQRGPQLRGAGSQQAHGLCHVPPGRGGAHREPGRQLGERLALAQVDQDQQGLLPAVQLAPARADPGAVAADDAGQVGQRGTRQRQRGAVEKHQEPLGGRRIVVIASSTRDFTVPEGDTPCAISTNAGQLPDQDEKGSVVPGTSGDAGANWSHTRIFSVAASSHLRDGELRSETTSLD